MARCLGLIRKKKRFYWPVFTYKLEENRELKQRRRQRQRKRNPKMCLYSFVLLRDYFNSLNFYKNGQLSRNQIGRSGVQFKKEIEKFTVVRSRSPQYL